MPTVVYTPGCWDLFHLGHLVFLQRARSLGDKLIVGVASDRVIMQDKGSPPIIPLIQRCEIIQALRCVDEVRAYYSLDFIPHLKSIDPTVLAVGEEWGDEKRHKAAVRWMSHPDKKIVKLARTSCISSSEIRGEIIKRYKESGKKSDED